MKSTPRTVISGPGLLRGIASSTEEPDPMSRKGVDMVPSGSAVGLMATEDIMPNRASRCFL